MSEVSVKKRLVLVNPENPMRKGIFRRSAMQPPLSLAIVAALTPPDWKVRIIDENFRSFTFKEADLVGISALSSTAPRAYEIARQYREKGIPVVLGGIHATLMADEALQYVDSVVIGHAEATWEELIRDFEKGELKKSYKGIADVKKKTPVPRYDLLHPAYLFGSIQSTRGCQMNCDFCTIPVVNQHRYQLRDVEEVLNELEAIPHKLIYIVDDNLIGIGSAAREHARALFQGMIDRKLNKEWFAYVTLSMTDDEELVELAAKSGCKMVLIGMESENPEELKNLNKKMNLRKGPESYRRVARILHKYGICVVGSFIFGLETDTPEKMNARLRFMLKSPIDIPHPNVMTPFPGTKFFDHFVKEDRLIYNKFPEDWRKYNGAKLVFRPRFFEPSEFNSQIDLISKAIYRLDRVIIRFFRTWWNTRNLRTAVWAYSHNMNQRSLVRQSVMLLSE